MSLHKVKAGGIKRQRRKRKARGESSGNGRTAGRGEKGQRSRSGSFGRTYFEGGQTPMFRRLPKRGFTGSLNKPREVNLERLVAFDDGAVVDLESLRAAGLIRKKDTKIKIIGKCALEKKLTVKAAAFTAGAIKSIEDAGGKAEKI